MRLNELYAKYRDRVQFYMVYIREAHPSDGWQVPNNLIEDILFPEQTTAAQRSRSEAIAQKNRAGDQSIRGAGALIQIMAARAVRA